MSNTDFIHLPPLYPFRDMDSSGFFGYTISQMIVVEQKGKNYVSHFCSYLRTHWSCHCLYHQPPIFFPTPSWESCWNYERSNAFLLGLVRGLDRAGRLGTGHVYSYCWSGAIADSRHCVFLHCRLAGAAGISIPPCWSRTGL